MLKNVCLNEKFLKFVEKDPWNLVDRLCKIVRPNLDVIKGKDIASSSSRKWLVSHSCSYREVEDTLLELSGWPHVQGSIVKDKESPNLWHHCQICDFIKQKWNFKIVSCCDIIQSADILIPSCVFTIEEKQGHSTLPQPETNQKWTEFNCDTCAQVAGKLQIFL